MQFSSNNNRNAFDLGYEFLLQKEYSHAIREFSRAISEGLEEDISTYYITLCLRLLGDFKKSNKILYEGLIKDPHSEVLNSLNDTISKQHLDKHDGPVLSIIVPVYNSAQYLERCLESIISQSFTNFELIIVNDGSTDSSSEIISSFSKNDERVKVINNITASGNPGTPRNQALELAKGAYIGFVDSDDWIDSDFYSVLMEKAYSDYSDIVFSSGFVNEKSNGRNIRYYSNNCLTSPNTLLYKYHESFMIWDKVFSSRLLTTFSIRLGETRAAVDVPFIIKSYYYSHKTNICDRYIGYHYRRESNTSVTVNYRKSSSCDFELAAFNDVIKWAKKTKVRQFYLDQIDYRQVNSLIYTLSVITPKMFDSFYEKAKNVLKNFKLSNIAKYAEETGKTHVLKRFVDIKKDSSSVYKKKYRKDINKVSNLRSKKPQLPIEDRFSFELNGSNKGILFFPDWSANNPYQKLLYSAIATNFNINIRGYKQEYLCRELLEKSTAKFSCIHLHWLHTHIDFTRDDGANDFIDKIKYAKSLGYKVLYTAHNIISHDSMHAERELKIRRKVIDLFDYIFVHGELAKARIIDEIGANPDHVFIVPHGSYEGYYPNFVSKQSARMQLSIKSQSFVFLFFGNIKGYKGVDELLKAYKDVSSKRPNCNLVIAGRVFDTSAEEKIQDYCKRDNSIIFKPGFIQEFEVQYYLNSADVVVLPYKKILTSGAAALSFAFRKKVIAPRSGLLPELIEDGKQGFLFDDFDHMREIMMEVKNEKTNNCEDFDKVNRQLRWTSITSNAPFKSLFGSQELEDKINDFSPQYDYALIRILGNDLPQRHTQGQTLNNLLFTLENEKDFINCHKLWILNRIIDEEKCEKIKALLDKYNKDYVEIPFSSEELAKQSFCYHELPCDDFKFTEQYEQYSERQKVIVETALLKDKNNYIMNNNGARNRALEIGRSIAKWTFAWDGNCFISEEAWKSICFSLNSREDAKYHIVPMERILSNDHLLDSNHTPKPVEEPQIIFKYDSKKYFNDDLMYGLKPKVDLLKKLGVPGVWDKWKNLYPWKAHEISYDNDTFNYSWSGWTARLFSGNQGQETDADDRALKREKGIVEYIVAHDSAEILKKFCSSKLAFYNEELLDSLKNEPDRFSSHQSTLRLLDINASKYVNNKSYSVTTKTTLPPSNDKHDYWHPAPYAWPNPDTKDGLPYVHRDGQRVPGTRMYEEDSVKYDRTSLQRLFDETTTLALAGYIFSNDNYMLKAYQHIKTWFIDTETSMNPNFNFAQVVMGKNDNKGTASGLIEMKDLYFFLDAVRLVKRCSFWTEQDEGILNAWFTDYYLWLNESEQGNQEKKAKNNHGNAYDLQSFAIAAFLGLGNELYDIYIRAGSRIKSHVKPNGEQSHELKRTTTAHYTAFNLHLWLSLNTLVDNTISLSFINLEQLYGDKKIKALEKAAYWVLTYGILPEWPFKQIDTFDSSRYQHIFHNLKNSGSTVVEKFESFYPSLSKSKDLYFPHDGIAPYWKLALSIENFSSKKEKDD